MPKSKKTYASLVTVMLMVGIVIALNVIGNFFYETFDVTEEKRYTLTDNSREFVAAMEDELFVKVWLAGDLPAGFERMRERTEEILRELRQINPSLSFEFRNPNQGDRKAVNKLRQELAKDEMRPITLRIQEQGETVDKIIYPYCQIYRGKENIAINLLSTEGAGFQSEETINEAIAMLEYNLINGMRSLSSEDRPIVIFTRGHDELSRIQTGDLINSMSNFYQVGQVYLDSVAYLSDEADVLIVAKPRSAFSDKDKFKIDQYLMRGGRVIWLLDKLGVTIDSLRSQTFFVPPELPLNLNDQLFTYGVRIRPNLVLDLECTKIPLQVGEQGGQPQFDLFDWYYHIAAAPAGDHITVRNLDRVNLLFPSAIDTIKTETDIDKTVLLSSSEFSRLQFNPVRLNFEILRYDPDKSKFNQGSQNLAVLYEGEFQSHFKDRVTAQLKSGLEKMGVPFRESSEKTKMIVVSDGDVVRNLVDPRNQTAEPLGYNPYEQYVFDNKNFILNCIDYLIGDGSIVEARTKKLKLRLMNMPKVEQEKAYWQVFNLAGPLVLLFVFGGLYNYARARRFIIKKKDTRRGQSGN